MNQENNSIVTALWSGSALLHSLLSGAVPLLQLLLAVPSLSSEFCLYRRDWAQPLWGRHGRSRQPTTARACLRWRRLALHVYRQQSGWARSDKQMQKFLGSGETSNSRILSSMFDKKFSHYTWTEELEKLDCLCVKLTSDQLFRACHRRAALARSSVLRNIIATSMRQI